MKQWWKQFLESPYPALMSFRLIVMLLMLGSNFYNPYINKILIVVALLVFIGCTLGIHYLNHKVHPWVFFVIELVLAIWFGIDVSYPLLVGMVGIGLFYYYQGKWLYFIWSLFTLSLLTVELVLDEQKLVEVLINFSFIVFATMSGGLLRYAYQMKNRSWQLYQELGESYEKLKKHAQTVEKLAAEEERNRIAREIHDTVGHTITALIFQLEAGRKLMSQDPDKGERMIQTSEELARSIYREMRLSIESNGQDMWRNLDLPTLLQQLLQDFARLTQMDFQFQLDGNLVEDVTHEQKFSLYRMLQETLTNAKRHGEATQVDVTLRVGDDTIQLTVQDDGAGIDTLQLGFGLKNMQSRAESLGGTCEFVTQANVGFRTVICLPKKVRADK